jgi:hypothetical protein
MSTKPEQSQARAQKRRRRTQPTADRRQRDRGLVPGVVAERVGIAVAERARAMRAAGIHQQLTEAEGQP